MKNINWKILMPVLAVLSLISCVKEVEPGGGTYTDEGPVSVLLSLDVPGLRASSRALTAMQEDAIQTIDVFVFDRNDKLTDWTYGTFNSSGDGFTAVIEASRDNTDTYRLMVLANARHITYPVFRGNPNSADKPGGDDIGGHINKTYSQVCSLLVSAIEQTPSVSTTAAYSTNGIPMWGMMKDAEVINESNKSFSMNMLRSVAMIDVGTNPAPSLNSDGSSVWAGLSNFSLEKVYLYNSNKSYSVIPAAGNYNYTTKKTTALSLPASAAKFPNTTPIEYSDDKQGGTVLRSSGKGYAVASAIYAAEADVIMGGTYGDGNHTQRTSLVVAGYYNGSSDLSYYRLDFAPGGNLINLLRNNAYQITIHSVSGPGSDNIDDAFDKFGAEMDIVVNRWSPADLEGTTVSGEYYLRVNPYDPRFDKYAKTGEEITVDTNVPVSGGKSWSAAKTTVDNGDDISWLTLVNTGGVTGGILKINVAAMPEGSDENDIRQAKIRLTAGTMVHDIIVKQSGADSDHSLRLSHSELVFVGRKWDENSQSWTDPDPQNLTVKWGPTRWPYALNLTDYTNGGVDMAATVPADNDTPTLTISPAAVEDDNTYLAANPFFERSSRLAVTAYDINHTAGQSITKQVVIRQVYYSIVITGAQDYYYQGKTYTFKVKSNTDWATEITGSDIFASVTGTTGGNNTSSGQNFTFKIKDGAAVGATATIKFYSPSNLFPPQTYTVNAQDIKPNCYMVRPGESVTIPVTKAYRTWLLDHDLGIDMKTLPGVHEVRLLWQDAWHGGTSKGIIASVGPLTSPANKADAEFSVTTNDLSANGIAGGNAVVAYLIDGTVYWSWHIWVTGYDPQTGSVTAGGYTYMDRNLGATGNSGYAAHGTFFQGGRKDPFPPMAALTGSTQRKIYDINGNILTYGQPGGIEIPSAPPSGGLPASVKNPMSFLRGNYGNSNWFGLFDDNYRPDLWWNGNKAEYDPCPAGWKVMNVGSQSGMSSIPIASANFTWNGMYFPAQGIIRPVPGLWAYNGTYTCLYFTNGLSGTAMRQIMNTTNNAVNTNTWGAAVRCIKE